MCFVIFIKNLARFLDEFRCALHLDAFSNTQQTLTKTTQTFLRMCNPETSELVHVLCKHARTETSKHPISSCNVPVNSSRKHPPQANPRAYPRHLKKLFKCLALPASFVCKCPAPRSLCGDQMPGPPVHPINIYLLLAECEVRTASYGPSFFLPFMAQARSARAMKTRKEKTRIHNLSYGSSKRG